MKELSSTPHGRLVSAAITLALVGGGLSVALGGPITIPLMGISLLGAVCICIVALATAIEPSPEFTMLSVILLPVALFLYMVGLGVVAYEAPWGAYAFMALGALFGLNGLSGYLRSSPQKPGRMETAHQEG